MYHRKQKSSVSLTPFIFLLSLGTIIILSFYGVFCLFFHKDSQSFTSHESGSSIKPTNIESSFAEADSIIIKEAKREIALLDERAASALMDLKEVKNNHATHLNHDNPEGCATKKEYDWWVENRPGPSGENKLRVINWNLWNLQEQWSVRRDSIAAMLRELRPHVVGLQEIRIETNGKHQLEDLAVISGYPYFVYQHAGDKGRFEEEGVGIMSMLPIVSHEKMDIPRNSRSSDLNPRVVLHVILDASNILASTRDFTTKHIDVYVTHLSYDSGEQCRQIVHLRRFLDATSKSVSELDGSVSQSLRGSPKQTWEQFHDQPLFRPQILMGDFNIYQDHEWPMDYLTSYDTRAYEMLRPLKAYHEKSKHLKSGDVGCEGHRELDSKLDGSTLSVISGSFQDAWELTGNAGAEGVVGWTFPNLPGAKNDAARCDRVLFRSSAAASEAVGIRSALSVAPSRSTVIGCIDIPGALQKFEHSNKKGTPLRQSDHRAVVVDFSISVTKTENRPA